MEFHFILAGRMSIKEVTSLIPQSRCPTYTA
jgi:hypothetical protein